MSDKLQDADCPESETDRTGSLPLCKDVYPPDETVSLCRAGQFKLVFPTSNALGKVSFFVAAKIRMPYDDQGKEQDRLIHSASQTFPGKSL